MKLNIITALAIGALISTMLLAFERLTDFALLSWELPGISVAYVFWGVIGGSNFTGIAIGWAVNALVYGFGAFAILCLFRAATYRRRAIVAPTVPPIKIEPK